MRIDPAFAALLALPEMQVRPPPAGVTAQMMRDAIKQLPNPLVPPPIHATRAIRLRGAQGELDVRLYYPVAARALPLIVFYHGGGFVLCDLDTHDPLCRALANASGCAVASVAYRLAPETRFPGPLEDCYAALQGLARAGVQYGFDATRLAVCGDSAGGNLAAAVALLARDRKGPALRCQALLYPVLDAGCDSASMRELAEGYMLSRAGMQWFWACYLGNPADGANPLASPLLASDLSGLPPATVITAEFDPLRAEGEAYADRLREAQVAVTARRYLGMIHGFMSMPHITPVANRAIDDAAFDLKAALGQR
jgi:acetyl esterase